MATTSPFQGWHSRALSTPHVGSHSLTADSLILAVLLNAQAEPDGISLAFFADPSGQTTVVDALGRVSIVAPNDVEGILSLANRALALPDTGAWQNTWTIKHPVTCQPNHRILISPQASARAQIPSAPAPGDLKLISVQGFSEKTRELSAPVQGYTELPSELWELTGLLLEARKGAGPGVKRDDDVLGNVRSVVKPFF